MSEAKDGFSIPHIDYEKCIGCGKCVRACHILTGRKDCPTPLKTYACWTNNRADIIRSSSGGAFSVLARNILKSQGAVFGASMTRDLKVEHIAIEDEADIPLLQGSKYVQSYLGNTYMKVREFLETGRKVLFTGTPCQIAGLMSYLHKPFDNLYTCDIVCHGVPSQKSFDIYTQKTRIKGNYTNVIFRHTERWGFLMRASKEVHNGSEVISKSKTLWPSDAYYLKAFSAGLMTNEVCFSCPYAGIKRTGDITIADYWGIGEREPFNHSTRYGISLLLINSDKGMKLINECDSLVKEERPLQEAIDGNFNLSHPTVRPEGRDTYFKDSQTMTYKELSRKYRIGASVKDYLRTVIKSLISIFERWR